MAVDDLPTTDPSPPAEPFALPGETRNVLNYLGETIGTLTLPGGQSEAVWTAALAPYAIQNPVAPNFRRIETLLMSATNSVTTSSGTAAVVDGMSKKPDAGVYQAEFNGSVYTDGASAKGEFGIYVDGVLVSETRRDVSCSLSLLGGLVTVSLNALGIGTFTSSEITLNGNQTIEVRYRSTNGGTIGFKERVFTLMRVK